MFLKDCMFAHQVRERRWFVSKKSDDDDDVCYYIGERLKLEGETENRGVCTKEQEGMTAVVLMATPCTKSLECEREGHKHGGDEGRKRCWKFATKGSTCRGRRRAALRRGCRR